MQKIYNFINTQKYLKEGVFLIVILFSSCSYGQKVYVTKTGEKYHTYKCRFLKYSKKEIELDKAVYFGYLPCKVCKPLSVKKLHKEVRQSESQKLKIKSFGTQRVDLKRRLSVQCSGKTKSRRRCKRKTKNASGKCYQHE
ncbi:hypothetical protein SAMN04489761_4349 [Tenacibaculum sp. MAR_2009_124]|nr:hypothetical protein SAMN04489761_4349 [Tenacibaculum sp. MAR_2009_124]